MSVLGPYPPLANVYASGAMATPYATAGRGVLPTFPNGPMPQSQWSGFTGVIQPAPGQDVSNQPAVRALVPCPNTPQYGGPWPRAVDGLQLPSEAIRCASWAQAQIRHKSDLFNRSVIDEVHDSVYQKIDWFYTELDGWVVQMWDKDTYDPYKAKMGWMQPVASIDIRSVKRAELYAPATFAQPANWTLNQFENLFDRIAAEQGGALDEQEVEEPITAFLRKAMNKPTIGRVKVSLLVNGGSFDFWVRTEAEARMWCESVNRGIAENAQFNQRRKEFAIETAEALRSGRQRIVDANEAPASSLEGILNSDVHPEREPSLKRYWADCVRAAGRGEKLPVEALDGIFGLYDEDWNGSLSLEEMEVLIRELFLTRRKELLHALQQRVYKSTRSDSMLLDAKNEVHEAWRTVRGLGDNLLKQYDHLLHRDGFENRCSMMRSKLDTTSDGRVDRFEFIRGAPLVFLTAKELLDEATFYQACSRAIQQSRKFDRWMRQAAGEHDSDEDDESCIQM